MKILVLGFLLMMGPVAFGAEEAPATAAPKGFGIAVGPSKLRLIGKGGVPQTASIKIWNKGPKPIQVISELSDVGNALDETGRLTRRFLPPGTLPHSCAKWVILGEQEFTVEAGSEHDVSIVVSPPANASGGTSCVAFFRGIPALDEAAEHEEGKPVTTVVVQPRLGVLLFFEALGTVTRQGNLMNLQCEPPAIDRPLRIQYEFENTGNADILLTGTFHILDAANALVAKGELEALRAFPGDKGQGETQWAGSLPSGEYQLVLTFELGPDAEEVIVKEIPISVP